MRQATIRHEMEKVILSKICKSVSPDEIQAIVAKCIYQATNDYFNQVESIRLKVPSVKEVEKMVQEPDFDEMKIASYIKPPNQSPPIPPKKAPIKGKII